MNQFLNSIPKALLVTVSLVVALIVIVLAHPPHTVCDSQVDILKQNLRDVLFPDLKIGKPKPRILQLEKQCRESNSPGGCYELFRALRQMRRALALVPRQCNSSLASISEVARPLHEDLALMALLAWGSQPPVAEGDRAGWLDTSDLGLFCGLESDFVRYYGASELANFENKVLAQLPGANGLAPAVARRRSLFAVDCQYFQ